jgi:branched-chain amino acid aminotransferase
VNEQPVTINDVEHADEIFLTNAISGILWVRQVGEKNYNNTLTTKIYRQHIEPLWR